MTMARRAAYQSALPHRVLLAQGDQIVLTHNGVGMEVPTGDAISLIAGVLLDQEVTQSFIAGIELFDLMAKLNVLMEKEPGWRMRFTNRKRYAYTQDGRKIIAGRFFCDYFAIDQKITRNQRAERKRVDVINLDLLREKPPHDPVEQMEMSLAILELCENRGVKFRGTRGAIANAMLKVSPHWEKKRYAAPKFINDMARPYLPGNFYALSWNVTQKQVRKYPHCYYIDQTSSHHSIAREIVLPHPQHIHARGKYSTQEGLWCKPDSPMGETLMRTHHGLFLCKVHVGTVGPSMEHLYPPWALKRGNHYRWIWSPEFRLFQNDHRLQLEGFTCALSGTIQDLVLPEYAEFALREIAEQPRAGYKKGVLLAAYGMLAFNAAGHTIYRYWGGNTSRNRCEIPLAGTVGESRVKIPSHVQISTVNVIARGLIESETRTRSIEYARELNQMGLHIPQIYADGLLVESDYLPFVREGWRISHSLTNVHIPRSNAILSDQIVKLPGVADQDREWMERREEAMSVLGSRHPMARERIREEYAQPAI